MKIYTKKGDGGETSLVGGTRLPKCDANIDSYGDVDELNCWLGMCATTIELKEQARQLQKAQEVLFVLGSNLACEKDRREKYKLPQLCPEDIAELEALIDQMDTQLPPLKNFILPGGTSSASHLHLARTCCRRAERKLVALDKDDPGTVPPLGLAYLNRLSDFLFVLARYTNAQANKAEHLWIPCVKS